jgi:hypothetical protein
MIGAVAAMRFFGKSSQHKHPKLKDALVYGFAVAAASYFVIQFLIPGISTAAAEIPGIDYLIYFIIASSLAYMLNQNGLLLGAAALIIDIIASVFVPMLVVGAIIGVLVLITIAVGVFG